MAKFSEQLLSMLCDFLVNEIGSKALYGITYTMLIKGNSADEEKFERYMEIRREATNCGYEASQVFTVTSVANGWVFDLDIKTAKQIIVELSKTICKDSKEIIRAEELIRSEPDKRLKHDMDDLINKIVRECNLNKNEFTFAIYSKNTTPVITFKSRSGGIVGSSKVDAYALRSSDLDRRMVIEIMKKGVCLNNISVRSILPSKTGVLCTAYFKRVAK